MKSLFLALCTALCASFSFAQDIKQGDNGRFGIYDGFEDRWSIDPAYDKIESILDDEGYSTYSYRLYKDGKIGFYSYAGGIIEPIYDAIKIIDRDFIEEYCFEVEINGKKGLLTFGGSSKVIYDEINPISEGNYIQGGMFEAIVGKNVVLLSLAELNENKVEPEAKYPNWNFIEDPYTEEASLLVYWGKKGCAFYHTSSLSYYGQPNYRLIGEYDDYGVRKGTNIIFVSNEGKEGLIMNSGQVLDCIYDELVEIDYADETLFLQANLDGQKGLFGFSDYYQDAIIPLRFDDIVYTGSLLENPQYFVQLNNRWGLYSEYEGQVTPIMFDDMVFVDENTYQVSIDGQWGEIGVNWGCQWKSNLDGKKPGKHTELDLSGLYNGEKPEGYVASKSDYAIQVFQEAGKFGYMYDVEIYCPPIFNNIERLDENLLIVEMEGKKGLSGLYPLSNTSIVYDRIETNADSTEFHLIGENVEAIYNIREGYLIEGGYQSVQKAGPSYYIVKRNGRYGIKHIYGAETSVIFDKITISPDSTMAFVELNSKVGVVKPDQDTRNPSLWFDSVEKILDYPSQYISRRGNYVGLVSEYLFQDCAFDAIHRFQDSNYVFITEKNGSKGILTPEHYTYERYDSIKAAPIDGLGFFVYDEGWVNYLQLYPYNYETYGMNESIIFSEKVDGLLYAYTSDGFWKPFYQGESSYSHIGYDNLALTIDLTEKRYNKWKAEAPIVDSLLLDAQDLYFLDEDSIALYLAMKEESYLSSDWLTKIDLERFDSYEKVFEDDGYLFTYKTMNGAKTGFLQIANNEWSYLVDLVELAPVDGVQSFFNGSLYLHPDSIGYRAVTKYGMYPFPDDASQLILEPIVADSFAILPLVYSGWQYDENYNEYLLTDTTYALYKDDYIFFPSLGFHSIEHLDDLSSGDTSGSIYFMVEREDTYGIIEVKSSEWIEGSWDFAVQMIHGAPEDALRDFEEMY